VQRDLTLVVDGERLRLRLVSSTFPTIEEMSQGLGAIALAFEADVAPGGSKRWLIFRNRHLSGIAVYLVNGLVPTDPDIRAGTQRRNQRQSLYELDYMQTAVDAPTSSSSAEHMAVAPGWLGAAALCLLAVLTLMWRASRTSSARENGVKMSVKTSVKRDVNYGVSGRG
jgi:hypothetical protein